MSHNDPMRQRRPRPRAVVALPNGFTLANLFFGIFAIVAASRGEFDAAARYVVFGAIADTLDGRIARATKSGSRFGEELDSLVDAISFGTAPGLIMYFAVFQKFLNYYGNTDYGDKWILAALDATPTNFASGRGNADFSNVSFAGRGRT